MADESFVIELVLHGAEGVKQGLNDAFKDGSISAAALSTAIGKVDTAAAGLTGTIAKVQAGFAALRTATTDIGAGIGKVTTAYNQLDTAAVRAFRNTSLLVATIAGAGAAVAAFAASGVRAADALNDQAKAAGLTTDRYQELQHQAAQLGISQGQLATGMNNFNRQVADLVRDQSQSLLKFVDVMGKIQLPPGVTQIQKGFQETSKVIREGADIMQAKLKELGQNFTLGQVREEMAKLANGTSATRAEFEKLTGLTLPSGNAALDALRQRAEGGRNALQKLGLQIKTAADGTIDMDKALLDTADAFAKMADGPEKTALALQLFGRNVGPKLVPFLNQGRKGIEEVSASLRGMGLLLTGDEIKLGDRVQAELDTLGLAATRAKDKLSLLFAPSLSQAVTGLTGLITQNQLAFQNFGRAINEQVFPYVKAFFDLLAGKENRSLAGEQLKVLQQQAIAFGRNVQDAVNRIVIPAFNGLMAVFRGVAAVINQVFGTQLTGPMVLAALVVARLTGALGLLTAAFRLVAASAGLVFTLLRGFVAVLGWPTALAAGLLVLINHFVSLRDLAQRVAAVFNSLFNTNIGTAGGAGIIAAIGAIGAAFLIARARALTFGAALTGLLRHPFFIAIAALAVALGLLDSKFLQTGDAAKKTGDDAAEATPKIENFAGKIIDVKKQLAEKTSSSMADNIKKAGASASEAKPEISALQGAIEHLLRQIGGEELVKAFREGFKVKGPIQAIFNELKSQVPTAFRGILTEMEGMWNTFIGGLIKVDKATQSWSNFLQFLKDDFNKTLAEIERGKEILFGRPQQKPTEPSIFDTGEVSGGAQQQQQLKEGLDAAGNAASSAAPKVEEYKQAVAGAGQAAVIAAATGNEYARKQGEVVQAQSRANFAIENGKIILQGTAEELGKLSAAQNKTNFEIDKFGRIRITGPNESIAKIVESVSKVQQQFADLTKQTINEANLLRDAFGPVEEAIKKIAPAVDQTADKISTGFSEVGFDFDETATSIGDDISRIINTPIPGAFSWMDSAFTSVANLIKTGATELQTIIADLTSSTAAIGAAPQGGGPSTLIQSFDLIKQAVDLAAQGVATFGQNFASLGQNLQIISTIQNQLGTLGQAATTVGQSIGQAIQAISAGFQPVLNGIVQLANTVMGSISSSVAGAEGAITVAIQSIIGQLEAAVRKAQELASAANAAQPSGGGGGSGAGFAQGGRVFGQSGTDKVPAWLTRDEFVMRTAAVRKYGVAFMQAINAGRYAAGGTVQGFVNGGSPFRVGGSGEKTFKQSEVEKILFGIKKGVEDGMRIITQSWNTFANKLETTLRDMALRATEIAEAATRNPEAAMAGISELSRTIEGVFTGAVADMAGAARQMENGIRTAVEAVKFASGGHVQGPGGIDRVPAWLSSGEFVMTRDAVRRYGLGFMNAVNSGGLMMNAGLDVPRYAAGGLVAPAGSGAAKVSRPINLSLDGQVFQTSATDDVAQRLERSVLSRRRAGRAPTWKR